MTTPLYNALIEGDSVDPKEVAAVKEALNSLAIAGKNIAKTNDTEDTLRALAAIKKMVKFFANLGNVDQIVDLVDWLTSHANIGSVRSTGTNNGVVATLPSTSTPDAELQARLANALGEVEQLRDLSTGLQMTLNKIAGHAHIGVGPLENAADVDALMAALIPALTKVSLQATTTLPPGGDQISKKEVAKKLRELFRPVRGKVNGINSADTKNSVNGAMEEALKYADSLDPASSN